MLFSSAYELVPEPKATQSFAAFDELLPYVGDFGRYQKLLIWLVCLPACIPCGFHAFNQLFMADVPEHWCRVPALEVSRSGLTDEIRKKLSIPMEVRAQFRFTKLQKCIFHICLHPIIFMFTLRYQRS